MRIAHISYTSREEGCGNGVEKFADYLKQATGCQIYTSTKSGIGDPVGLNQKLIKDGFIGNDTICITDGYWGLGIPKHIPVISVVHGTWKEFLIRNGLNPVSTEVDKQNEIWHQSNVKKVAVSESAAKYLRLHHLTEVDEIILNPVDINVYLPKQKENDIPIVLHCARDSNKSAGKIESIQKLLEGEFKLEYLDAKIGEEPTKFCRGDMFLQTSFYEGNSLACVLPDTTIITKNGPMKIKDLSVSDEVLTHTGFFRKITKTYNRIVNENIIKLKVQGVREPLFITKNHPILSIFSKKCFNKQHLNLSICKPTCQRNCNRKYYNEYKLKWTPSNELKNGDLLVFPRYKKNIICSFKIDILNHIDTKNINHDNHFVWSKFSNNPKSKVTQKIAKETGLSVHSIRFIREKHKTLLRNFKKETVDLVETKLKNFPNDILKINRYINTNNDLMSLFGYYLAEGWIHGNSIYFAFHEKETKLHNHIKYLMKKVFNVPMCNKHRKSNHGVELQFNSSIVSDFLKNIFNTGSKNKIVPGWILDLPSERFIPLLKSISLGDGYFGKKFQYTSVSYKMIYSLKLMYSKIGIYATEYKRKNGVYYLIITGEQYIRLLEMFNMKKPQRKKIFNKTWLDDNYIYIPLRQIEEVKYNGLVYNLEVEKDNSYVANNIVVHNCLEAMSCDLPVIASRAGLFEDTVFNVPVGEVVNWNSTPEEYADCIRFVWKHRQQYKPRQWVSENCSFEIFKEKWLKFISYFQEVKI